MLKIRRDSLEILGFSVHWYGVLIALGVLLGILLAMRREKRYGLKKDTVIDLALWAVPFSIVGARLYYVIFSWDFYRDDLLKIFSLREGGMAIYGSILAGVLVGFFFARARKISFWTLADLVAPSIALGQAIGRWGNFLNQEAFGAEVLNPNLHFFPLAVFIQADGAWHWATFFYESAWCALIVIFLLFMERRHLLRRRGDGFLWYAFLYALERAVVEGLRTDSLYWGTVRVSQALAALIAVVIAAIFAKRSRHPAGFVLAAFFLLSLILGANTLTAVALAFSSLALCLWAYGTIPLSLE